VAVNIAAVSASSEPSDIDASGKTAKTAAAMIPTRSLTIAHPSRPMSTIVAVPSAHDHTRWVRVLVILSADGTARNTM
jgi:hypothetical protein